MLIDLGDPGESAIGVLGNGFHLERVPNERLAGDSPYGQALA